MFWTKSSTNHQNHFFAILASVLCLVGCTKKRELISKVDPNAYVTKSEIAGRTFHLVRGIEDADQNNTVGATPGMSQDFGLVTARITETELQFLSAFDLNNRAETATVVASFPITSHFNIMREENDYKQQTNKIIEDKSLRWQDRPFMRVDWGKISSASAKLKFQLDGSDLEEESVVLLEDPKKDPNGKWSWLAESSVRAKFPYRFLNNLFTPGVDIAPGFRVTYRTHLLPVKTSDFRPSEYTIRDFARFGYFVTQQNIEDPYKGLLDKNIKTYPEIYNVCEPGTKFSCSTNKITWHLNRGFPKKYLPAARKAVSEWNKSFQLALGRTDTVVDLNIKDEADISDPSVNVIALFPHKGGVGLLGVAQGVVDPRTGEKISSRATVYEEGIRNQVNVADSLIDLIASGDDGDVLLKQAMNDGTAANLGRVQANAASIRRALHPSLRAYDASVSMKGAISRVRSSNTNAQEASARETQFFKNPKALEVLNLNELTTLTEMTGQPLMKGLGAQANPALQGFDRLLAVGDLVRSEKARNLSQAGLGIHGADLVDFAVENYLLQVLAKGDRKKIVADRERIKDKVAELVFYSTLLHEMGHTFGLRHNFKGSADRAHYHPKYEEMRKAVAADPSSNLRARLDSFEYSTVMDYTAEFYQGGAGGLGPYDHAAIRYGYNRSIDRETDAKTTGENFYFCTDHQVGESVLCRRFDHGSNASEITQNLINSYENYWAFKHFRRGRAEFDRIAQMAIQSTLIRTMLPIRQVMDEFFWQLATNPPKFENGACDSFYMDESIKRGEIANICNPGQAVAAAADPGDVSTWVRALKSDRVPPREYMAYGLADLIYANELAKNFFAGVLGATEPGTYVVMRPSEPSGPAKMVELPPGPNNRERLRAFARSQNVGEENLEKFIDAMSNQIVDIPFGPTAKPFYLSTSNRAGIRQLDVVGAYFDKLLALIALSRRDIGVQKYRDGQTDGARLVMFTNPYLYPQTRSFVSDVFSGFIRGEDSLLVQTVTFGSGVNAGKQVSAALPNAMNQGLKSAAVVLAATSFDYAADHSMISKLRVCTVDDKGCLTKFSEQSEALSFRSVNYDNEYRAAQSVDGDSIAYQLVTKAKEIDEKRRKLEKAFENHGADRDEALKKLGEAEPLRQRLVWNLYKIPELSGVIPLVGEKGDGSAWSQVEVLAQKGRSLSPLVVGTIASPIGGGFEAAEKKAEELLKSMGESGGDGDRRKALTELATDLAEARTIIDPILMGTLNGRMAKKQTERLSNELTEIEANLRVLHAITKMIEN